MGFAYTPNITYFLGAGLPAGKEEVELIEWERNRRALEAALPPLDDPTQLEKRKQMMQQLEMMEWEHRDQEISKFGV